MAWTVLPAGLGAPDAVPFDEAADSAPVVQLMQTLPSPAVAAAAAAPSIAAAASPQVDVLLSGNIEHCCRFSRQMRRPAADTPSWRERRSM